MRAASSSPPSLLAIVLGFQLAALASARADVHGDARTGPDSPRRVTAGIALGLWSAGFSGGEQPLLFPDRQSDADQGAIDRLAVGLMARVAVTARVAVRAEALFATAGGRASGQFMVPDFDDPTVFVGIPYAFEHTLRYLHVPLVLELAIPYDGAIHYQVFAGPTVSVLVDSDLGGDLTLLDADGNPTTTGLRGDISRAANRVDVGATVGAGVTFPLSRGALMIDLRLFAGALVALDGEFNVTVPAADDFGLPINSVSVGADKLRSRGFGLVMTYAL